MNEEEKYVIVEFEMGSWKIGWYYKNVFGVYDNKEEAEKDMEKYDLSRMNSDDEKFYEGSLGYKIEKINQIKMSLQLYEKDGTLKAGIPPIDEESVVLKEEKE